MLRLALNATRSSLLGCSLRGRILRVLGVALLPDGKISRGTRLGGIRIAAGPNFGANEECWIDDQVTFGRNVRLGPRVVVLTGSHPIGDADQRRGRPDTVRPVTIGDGCWLQTGATILPGVDVAAGCVVCAGAVVTKPTEPNGMYAGIPARRIADLPA